MAHAIWASAFFAGIESVKKLVHHGATVHWVGASPLLSSGSQGIRRGLVKGPSWEANPLNTLSFSNTQETMEQRNNTSMSGDYARTLRLTELVREYRDGRPVCPFATVLALLQAG